MRKIFVTICTLVIVLGISPVTSADIVNNLTGYWHLDGNGNDSSGHSNHLSTVSGTVSYDSSDKIAGTHSAVLGTASAYGEMQAASSGTLRSAWEMTFSTWVKFDSAPTQHYSKILNKWGGGSTGRLYQLYWDHSIDKFTFGLANSSNVGVYMSSDVVSPQAGTWYHLVVTAKTDLPVGQDNVWMYLTPMGETSITKVMQTEWVPSDGDRAMNYYNTKPFIIGSQYTDWQLEGKMDEVRYYQRHLSETEVQELYDSEVPEPATMLLLASGIGGLFIRQRSN